MLTPSGVKDFIPEVAAAHDETLNTIIEIFQKRGYQKVITPTIEYYETLEKAMGATLKRLCCRFFDPSGETLILRPDHTTPVARMVATHMKEYNSPLRLYYSGNVFRNHKKGNEVDLEVFQAGLELMGISSPAADAEVIKIAIECLKALNIKDFGIDIGHVDFLKNKNEEDIQALLKGDYISYGSIPERGSVEIVEEFHYLREIYEHLKKDGLDKYISFNKGLVKDLSYYTGIIFECYIKGEGFVIGSGGRYDNLVGKFGYECPSIGFGLNLNSLQMILSRKKD